MDRGKIRFIGVSNFSVSDLEKAQAALSRHKIVSNQVRYSLIDRTIEGSLLRYCEQQGIALVAYSPLACGLVPAKSISSRSARLVSVMRCACRRGGSTPSCSA